MRHHYTTQITARLPNDLVNDLDAAAHRLGRSRADVVRIAIDHYLEDATDIAVAIENLTNPADETLNWEEVRSELFD